MAASASPAREIVGRDAELDAVARWWAGPAPALLEIEGEPGIGKTMLCDHARGIGAAAGACILAYRPVEIETAVAYGALAALVEPVLAHARDDLPPPRLRALEAALRLRDVVGSRLDEAAVALGTLSLLRALARHSTVLLALDDAQWLDPSSCVALTYALGNLRAGDDVRVAVARRPAQDEAGLRVGRDAAVWLGETVRLGPLSPGALHRLVQTRLGVALPRPRLVRLHAISRGNPFHALELARAIRDAAPTDGAVPLPESLSDALDRRLDALSGATQRLLLLAAAAGEPTRHVLDAVFGPAEVDVALVETDRHGIASHSGGRLRFTHPLLASAAYARAPDSERRRTHAALAELADVPEERARHLALAGAGPDEAVASSLDHAAGAACDRGARSAAAALYEHAAALTPAQVPEARAARLVAAADAHFHAGDAARARALLEEVAAHDRPARFGALWRLGTLLDETVGGDAALAAFASALETTDAALAAEVHCSIAQVLTYVGDLNRALDHADAALAAAEPVGGGALARALAMQALTRKIAGRRDWRAPLERGLAVEAEVRLEAIDLSPRAVDAETRRLALDLDGARVGYEAILTRASEQGDVRAEAWCRFGLAATAISAADAAGAGRQSAELLDLAEQSGFLQLPARRVAAHAAVLAGDADRARALLGGVIADAERAGEIHNLRGALQVAGLLALALGDPAAALEPLRRARLLADEAAVGDPGMRAFAVDEVEALAATGDVAGASAVLDAFARCCEGADVSWAWPLLARGRGLVAAAAGDLDAALAALGQAVETEAALPLPLERARTRLVLGRTLRRARRRGDAHAALDTAVSELRALGLPLWVEQAGRERARSGGRAASRHDLTPAERRIAELVAEGRTNREVAAALYITPSTVEAALTRVYRKLGVRSRTELARLPAEPV